jgi:hypothetical protein
MEAVLMKVNIYYMLLYEEDINPFNPLKSKRKLFHLKTQFVPRSKHFSSRLKKTNQLHSFCSLSYDRSVASSKASSPQGAI